MKPPSKKEIEAEIEKIKKLYECYRFAYLSADDYHLQKKILELSRSHILAKIEALYYSVDIPTQKKLDELRKTLSRE